jgi:Arc/MetJ-type ribon-helix-helix transcriptional regulator
LKKVSIQSARTIKYQMVPLTTMSTQINLRLPERLFTSAKEYSESHGYGSIQEFIKDVVREKLFEEPEITEEELKLIKKLIKLSEKEDLYGTEEELFQRL